MQFRWDLFLFLLKSDSFQGEKEYEDPEYFYGCIGDPPASGSTQIRIVSQPIFVLGIEFPNSFLRSIQACAKKAA